MVLHLELGLVEKVPHGLDVAPGALHLVERLTRVDRDTIDYRATVEDPTVWSRPWTFELPHKKIAGPIFEYACHEGNYGLPNLLRGARVQEEPAGSRR